MLEYFWWGSVFLLNVPVMVVLLALGPVLLPEFRNPEPGRFDLLSAAQSLAAVLLVIFGVKRIAEGGLEALPFISIALGLFASRAFSTSVGSMTLGIFAFLGVNFFVAQYLQLVLGLSPLRAGLWTLPGAAAFIVTSNLAPRLVRRVRAVSIVSTGWVLAAAGLAVLTQIDADSSLALLAVANVLMAGGFGLVVTLVVEMILAAAPPERAGAASALSETSQEFGGALGLAVLGSLGTAIYRDAVAGGIPTAVPPAAAEAARDTLGGAVAAAAQLPDPVAAALLAASRDAFLQGLQLTAVIGATVFVGIAILVMAVLGRATVSAAPSEQPEPVAGGPLSEVECAA
jgi:DHA2 family multidrug resistance protein-like MFS transporter